MDLGGGGEHICIYEYIPTCIYIYIGEHICVHIYKRIHVLL